MTRERRAALHRTITAALAVLTAVLIFVHFKGREDAVEGAERQVRIVHDQARNGIAKEVRALEAVLRALPEGAPPPEPFSRLLTARGGAVPGMREVGERLRGGREPLWTGTFSDETDVTLEGGIDQTVPELAVALTFNAQGEGTVGVRITLVDDASPVAPFPVEVLFQTGIFPPEPLGPALEVGPGSPAEGSWAGVRLDVADRPRLVIRKPEGAPDLRLEWEARIGTRGLREIALGIERPGEDGSGDMLVGFVPLEHFVGRLRDLGNLETASFGDRVYLTDRSGTVVAVVPEFADRVKERVKNEGRNSLASPATQRVKLRNAGTDTYEGFARDRVIGAYGPLQVTNGGLIVERLEKEVLSPFRGVRAWNVAVGLLCLLLLYPLVPPIVDRLREDTELPRLLKFARTYLPAMAAIVAATIIYAGGQAAMAYFTKLITDDVLLSTDSTAYDRLKEICWVLLGIAGGTVVFSWIKDYFGKFIETRLIVDLRCILCEKIVNLPMGFHSKQRAGDLLSRINNDVTETKRGLEMFFGSVLTEPFQMVAFIATAFYINWRLALVVFFGLPILVVPISYFGRSIKRHARKRQAKKANVTHTINQMLAGIRVVKAFRMEDHEARRIRAVSEDFLRQAMRVVRNQVTSKQLLEFVQAASAVVIMAMGGFLVLEGQVTLGDLMAFVVLIGRMYRSSKQLAGTYNKLQESLAGTERIFEILDTPDELADRPNARALVRPRREIAFERVSFRYGDDQPWVLREIDYRTAVGRTIALVGATGAGKSTMLDLVARFYDPQEGRVTLDGIDLRDYSRSSLLSHIAVVTQDPFLFNASIAENLRYGKPGASQAELEAAARAANVHDEIVKQPDGYETIVGERGTRLSGGQRQRITIARAILKDPPILILDEATSALDSRAEKRVQDAIDRLVRDRTTFVIAHRLSTIEHADEILVMEEGRIVERGTHDELVSVEDGVYRNLYEIQYSKALEEDDDASDAPAAAAG